MTEKSYRTPAVAWLKITEFMHGWLQNELGGGARIGDKRVVCIQHLEGAKDLLRMETSDDVKGNQAHGRQPAWSLSATRRNCIMAGLDLDEDAVARFYGIGRDDLALYVPIECPKVCLTQNGVLRPWTNDVCFGQEQASALQRLLRQAFWQGVAEYNQEYAARRGGAKYAAVDMIEAFCHDTGTSDIYVGALRREWQRRLKRGEGKAK